MQIGALVGTWPDTDGPPTLAMRRPAASMGWPPWLHGAGNALDLTNATDNSHGVVIFK